MRYNISIKLTPSDAQLFYRLWLPLLDYVNEVYRVNPAMIDMAHHTGLDLEAVRAIATRLWDNPEIIDQYLSHNTQLPAEHRSIVESWKRRVRGNFFLERHQSQGSIFIDSQTNMVYLVSGITSAWSESFPRETLPVFLSTTLIHSKPHYIRQHGTALPHSPRARNSAAPPPRLPTSKRHRYPMQNTIIQCGPFRVTLIRKAIKNLYLRVLPPDGRIQVSAPLGAKNDEVCRLVLDKQDWILMQQNGWPRSGRRPSGRIRPTKFSTFGVVPCGSKCREPTGGLR